MNILLLDKDDTGGINIYNNRLISFLKKHGHQVTILRYANKIQKEKNIIYIPQYLYPEQITFTLFPSEKTLTIFQQTLKNIHPDLVYVCIGLSPFDFFLPKICHKLNIPIVGVWHTDLNPESDFYQLFLKSIFFFYVSFCKQIDLLHVFSKNLKKFYIQKGVSQKKIIVNPNGVDTNFYTPGYSEFAKKHHIETGVLFLGRLTFQKNPETVIKAFLKQNISLTTKLVLVGTGDLEKKLRQKYSDKKIIFTGNISDEKKKLDIIRSCQIFVLPSRFEGMSLALLEAMSCGLACIISKAGANKTILGKAGIVISTEKNQALLDQALKTYLNNPQKVKEIGLKARRRTILHYNEPLIFNKLMSAFKKLITN